MAPSMLQAASGTAHSHRETESETCRSRDTERLIWRERDDIEMQSCVQRRKRDRENKLPSRQNHWPYCHSSSLFPLSGFANFGPTSMWTSSEQIFLLKFSEYGQLAVIVSPSDRVWKGRDRKESAAMESEKEKERETERKRLRRVSFTGNLSSSECRCSCHSHLCFLLRRGDIRPMAQSKETLVRTRRRSTPEQSATQCKLHKQFLEFVWEWRKSDEASALGCLDEERQ